MRLSLICNYLTDLFVNFEITFLSPKRVKLRISDFAQTLNVPIANFIVLNVLLKISVPQIVMAYINVAIVEEHLITGDAGLIFTAYFFFFAFYADSNEIRL